VRIEAGDRELVVDGEEKASCRAYRYAGLYLGGAEKGGSICTDAILEVDGSDGAYGLNWRTSQFQQLGGASSWIF